MGGVQRQTSKGHSAHQVTQNSRNFVPDKVIHNREITPHDHRRWEQEHIYNRVLESHREEQHDRHPHSDDFTADRSGNHRTDHTH